MDDTVVACNIHGEVRKQSESLLSENSIVHEILTELTRVSDGLSLESGKVSSRNSSGGNSSRDDAVVEYVSGDRSIVTLISFDGSVSGCKDSEGSRSSKSATNTSGCETS